ncbi:GNAT family N-acetyltransferase [Endozoicomonas elysicola]|uniref:Acetyltransferase n=1 Tax=Endozoicomonas elysicola TaxID=305900 RepID=A0A081KFJ4_9GAMM|nr:GNAT family N-acetyltransferase [Endozoicomonas elysicola]KEI72920.1 acetyltransferase [Endozoicomonas elysicola]
MKHFQKTDSIELLKKLKKQYVEQATAPLDGMWLDGFAAMASHYGIYEDEMLIGYFCVNEEGYLLQFYLTPGNKAKSSEIFTALISQDKTPEIKLNGAFVSTAEQEYLSLCLDSFSRFEVNTLMYQLEDPEKRSPVQLSTLPMTAANPAQLTECIGFAVDAIGAPEQWLTGYYGNLIKRQELFGYWVEGRLIATGECRLFDDHQTDYADLGMIVARDARGKGLATRILATLIALTQEKGRLPILSTEKGNIGAQKAITRAGFISSNRIIKFTT